MLSTPGGTDANDDDSKPYSRTRRKGELRTSACIITTITFWVERPAYNTSMEDGMGLRFYSPKASTWQAVRGVSRMF